MNKFGVYHLDREWAKSLGDPLLDTIEAPSKSIAVRIASSVVYPDAMTGIIVCELTPNQKQ